MNAIVRELIARGARAARRSSPVLASTPDHDRPSRPHDATDSLPRGVLRQDRTPEPPEPWHLVPRMMSSIWPAVVGENTVALGDLDDPTADTHPAPTPTPLVYLVPEGVRFVARDQGGTCFALTLTPGQALDLRDALAITAAKAQHQHDRSTAP